MGIIMRTDQEENSIAVNGVTLRYAVAGEDHGSYIAGSETIGKLLIDFLERKYS